jgi:hypothetical protein
VTIGTKNEKWDIELSGTGRESVLLISRASMEFNDCIVGNVYEQKISLKNVGDVNYPLEFETEENSLSFNPPSVILSPFTEEHVSVMFRPIVEFKKHTKFVIKSHYSNNIIPVTLMSGIVDLEIIPKDIDFGVFEKSATPERKFTIRNIVLLYFNYRGQSKHITRSSFLLNLSPFL